MLLCRLKLTLLINSLKNWASVGKAIGVGLSVIFTAVLITSGSSDLIKSLKMVPYAELMLDWMLGGIILYVIFVVFTGDLITGHSLNTGQMSSDFSYLQTLPIPPFCLIFVKLFERVITDYLGLIILFSAFLGIACRDYLTFECILLATVLYLQISLLIGLLINLCTIFLSRFFRTTTINNIFSMLGYCSAFLTIAPYLILSNFPLQVMELIVNNLDILNETVFRFMLPVQWLSISLLSAAFCDEFFYFTAFWLGCMLVGTAIFHVTIKLNWFNFSHSNSRRIEYSGKRWFRGLYHKEVMLLKSDYNLLINALLMPITLIVLEIFFLKEVFKFSTPASILNIIAGSVIYFSMFGPVNAIGYEGRAISLLETLPMHPGTLLRRKFIFWTLLAEAIFVPATTITMYQMNYSADAVLKATSITVLLTMACVWVAINISAIFPQFDGKILQQRSTFAGKLAALGLMLLIVPVKTLSVASLYNLIIFICLGFLISYKAQNKLFFRLDVQAQCCENQKLTDILIMFLAFAGCEASITQFFSAVAPGLDTGMWNWFISALLFLPVSILLLLANKSAADNQKSNQPEKIHSFQGAGFLAIILTVLVIAISIRIHDYRPLATALFRGDVGQITDLAATAGLPPLAWNILLTTIVTALSTLLAWHTSRIISGSFRSKFIGHATTIGLLTLVAPPALMPVALITGIGISVQYLITDKTGYGIAMAAAASAGQAIFFTFY